VAFLACQVLGIVESQIETKQIFNIAGIMTTLRRFKLGRKNLERLVMITKNWPNDTHERCVGNIDYSMTNFLIREKDLINENEVMIKEEGLFDDDV
jgi:hypothetical protein